MAKLKKMTLETLLSFIPEGEPMVVFVFAYGMNIANTLNDGMKTAKDIKEQAVRDVLLAQVTEVRMLHEWEIKNTELSPMLRVSVEMTL